MSNIPRRSTRRRDLASRPRTRHRAQLALYSVLVVLLAATAALVTPGAGAAEPFEIGGTVSYSDGSAASGVKADLFAGDANGNRADFLGTVNTNGDGDYRFGVAPGCYVIVLEAPDGLSFDPDGPDRWHQQGACVTDGSVTDINATLHGAIALTIGGQVDLDNGAPAVAVLANLYTARNDNSRDVWQGSTTTDSSGRYEFDIDAGCYVIVLRALDGTSFDPNGPDQWHQESGCATDRPVEIDATLYTSDVGLTIGGSVTYVSGNPTAGIRANLYTALPNEQRDRWLGSGDTDASGNYSFDIESGCYVIVLRAPTGRSFDENGPDQWHQEHACVSGRAVNDIDATLYEVETTNTPRNPSCFTEVFRDDFNEESWGSAPESKTWRRYPSESVRSGEGNNGNGVRWHDAISVGDGLLNIEARMNDGVVHSGGMAHNFDQTYGFYEFRVRVDADWSEATSGVVLTWPKSDQQVPDGENDMFETIATGFDEDGNRIPIGNANRQPVKSFMHYTDGGIDRHTERQFVESDGTRWAIHAMEWVPGEIIFYRNGQSSGIITQNVPTAEHHMTIQLDAWLEEMAGPVDMQVDWVTIDAYTCGN